jgi:hypothetical protein
VVPAGKLSGCAADFAGEAGKGIVDFTLGEPTRSSVLSSESVLEVPDFATEARKKPSVEIVVLSQE